MNPAIDQLTKIETDAVQIIEHANTRKQELTAQYEEQKARYAEELAARTTASLDELTASLKQKNEAELAALRKRTQHILTALDQEYRHDHKKLTKQLVDHILGA